MISCTIVVQKSRGEIDQDTMECRARRNDVEVTIFENMVTLDPGSEKDVPLQPTYSESGVIKGVNSIVEGCKSDCEDKNSSNIKTEYWGSEDKIDGIYQCHLAHSDFSGHVYNQSKCEGGIGNAKRNMIIGETVLTKKPRRDKISSHLSGSLKEIRPVQ